MSRANWWAIGTVTLILSNYIPGSNAPNYIHGEWPEKTLAPEGYAGTSIPYLPLNRDNPADARIGFNSSFLKAEHHGIKPSPKNRNKK
jgi:hypothetical protein